MLAEHMEFNLKRNIHEEYQQMIASLKEELGRALQKIKQFEDDQRQESHRMTEREKELVEREQQAKRMYN